jgi:hypothetical protein
MLHSDSTPTFSHTTPSTYTPSYEAPDTWDCLTVIFEFSETVPAHPFDILPCLTPEPVDLGSLLLPGHIPLTALLSSAPIGLTETLQSSGSQPSPIRLMPTP